MENHQKQTFYQEPIAIPQFDFSRRRQEEEREISDQCNASTQDNNVSCYEVRPNPGKQHWYKSSDGFGVKKFRGGGYTGEHQVMSGMFNGERRVTSRPIHYNKLSLGSGLYGVGIMPQGPPSYTNRQDDLTSAMGLIPIVDINLPRRPRFRISGGFRGMITDNMDRSQNIPNVQRRGQLALRSFYIKDRYLPNPPYYSMRLALGGGSYRLGRRLHEPLCYIRQPGYRFLN